MLRPTLRVAFADVRFRLFALPVNALASLVRRAHRDWGANRRSHQDLEFSEERFSQLARLAGDWLWKTDARGRLSFVAGMDDYLTKPLQRPALETAMRAACDRLAAAMVG